MQSHQWLFSNWAASLCQGLFMAHTHHWEGVLIIGWGVGQPVLEPHISCQLSWATLGSLLGFWEVDTEMETEGFCEGKREETRLSWRSSQTLMGLTDLSAASVEVQSWVCLLDWAGSLR